MSVESCQLHLTAPLHAPLSTNLCWRSENYSSNFLQLLKPGGNFRFWIGDGGRSLFKNKSIMYVGEAAVGMTGRQLHSRWLFGAPASCFVLFTTLFAILRATECHCIDVFLSRPIAQTCFHIFPDVPKLIVSSISGDMAAKARTTSS